MKASLLVGDSQAAGMAPLVDGIDVRHASGRRIQHFVQLVRMRPALFRTRETIVLQMGGNDVSAGRSAAQIQRDFTLLVAALRRVNPQARIVIGTITPRGEWFDATGAPGRETIEAVNAWLHASNPADGVFEAAAAVEDPARPGYQRDAFERAAPNVHFNRAGYGAMTQALRRALGAKSP